MVTKAAQVLLLIVVFFCSATLPVAQAGDIAHTRAEMIRNSPEYRHGEGYGATLDEAKGNAARDLATGIRTMVHGEQKRTTIETTEALTDTFESRTSLVTMIQLQGMEFIDLGEKGGKHHAFAFISEENLAASNQRQKNRVRALLIQAEQERQLRDIDVAARDAYWAYLLSHTVLDTLQLNLPGATTGDPRFDILEYLSDMLGDVRFEAQPAFDEGAFIVSPVKVGYQGQPVRAMAVSFYGGAGTDYATVTGGLMYLPVSLTPPYPKRHTLKVRIEFEDEGGMRHHDDILALHEIFRIRSIQAARHTVRIPIPFGRELAEEPVPVEEAPAPRHETPAATPVLPEEPPPPVIVTETPDKAHRLLWPMTITVLADLDSTQAFMDALTRYKRNHRLEISNTGPDPLQARGLDVYLAIVDEEAVRAVLYRENGAFIDVRHNTRITDVSSAYAGAYQIWIGIEGTGSRR